MTTVAAYRLIKKKWLSAAFDGEGARRYGGRWNSRGKSCIYLAGSESLAMLEIMVHLNDYSLLSHYSLLQLHLPKKHLLTLAIDTLPSDWRDEPAPASTATIGDNWLASNSSLALVLPSVVVPREQNYLLNPAHTRFHDVISSATIIDFIPDKRL